MRPANILYLTSLGSLQGGGQRSALLLLKYLNREKFAPFLMVPEEGELATEASKLGVQTYVLPLSRLKSFNIFSIVRSFLRFFKIVKALHIEIIHTDCPRETMYAVLAAKFLDIRVVFHARQSYFSVLLDRIMYNSVDCIIAVSRCVAGRFYPIDKKNKVKVVYNGVELDVFRPSGSIKDKEKITLGYFGRIHREKGIETLIKAIKRIGKNIELVIVGDGDIRYVEKLKGLSGTGAVIFRNYKINIVDDMAGVDVVVLPSLGGEGGGEGLPRVLIEAMAMGKIVVASDLSAHIEILSNDLKQFIFTAGDDKNLAIIIEKIMQNRNMLYEKKESIRVMAEQLFDIRKKTQEIEDIDTSLLKKE